VVLAHLDAFDIVITVPDVVFDHVWEIYTDVEFPFITSQSII